MVVSRTFVKINSEDYVGSKKQYSHFLIHLQKNTQKLPLQLFSPYDNFIQGKTSFTGTTCAKCKAAPGGENQKLLQSMSSSVGDPSDPRIGSADTVCFGPRWYEVRDL
ncbi:hypothetical protein JTE90_007974 [Oedothorax gibbosus]|uniref:Uncharacterized protein n=1 Tax=Oedothorax gibbosus TaxID=931172 RepID=A0AAV6UPM2_9ARAC|nr:hypothetical protein JTE90_007974 [Oedothorax gibbosus]